MSKKKSKKRQAIDKAFEEMGITPVPEDHPIYKMGPSITFINKRNKINKKKDQVIDINSEDFKEFKLIIKAKCLSEGKSIEETEHIINEFEKSIDNYNNMSDEERAYYEEIGKMTMGESREDFEKFHNLSIEDKEQLTEDAKKKLKN